MERDAEFRGSEWDQPNEPHEYQVQNWADDVAEALLPWLKDFESYDDKVNFFAALENELRQIGEAAHAAGMLRQRTNA